MSVHISDADFEQLVTDELDALPDEMVDGIENVAFEIEALPDDGSHNILGLYHGVALTHRDTYGFGELPDLIVLYRENLLRMCDTIDELRDEVHVTLVHEIGHYFGIDDDRLHELGWA